MDYFLSRSIAYGYTDVNDILESVRIAGIFTTGAYTIHMNSTMLYDTIVVMDSEVIGVVSPTLATICSLFVNRQNIKVGEYL